MTERVFFLLKPDGVPREREILALLAPHALVVARRRFPKAPMRRFAALYAEHLGKAFHPWLMALLRGRPVVAFMLEPRPGIPKGAFHQVVADLVGDTDPSRAAPGTIRALSDDSLAAALRARRGVRNLCHRGRLPEDSQREGALFFWDVPSPASPGVEPGPFARAFVDPGRPSRVERFSGVFFDERLASLLRAMALLPRGSILTAYREEATGPGGAPPLVLRFEYVHGHRRHRRAVEVVDDRH